MAVTAVQVKRRATGGAAGAPASLRSGEIAYNMADGYFYVGYGDNGSGVATSIKQFAKDDFNISKLVPAGGTTGQVLQKVDNTDYNLQWYTVPAAVTYTAGAGLNLTTGQFSVNFSTVAALASPAFTGTPTAPTAAVDTNTTQLATTAYVINQGYLKSATAATTYAPIASPSFSGTPTAPTPTPGDNTTKIATTAFVEQRVTSALEGLDPKEAVRAATTGNIATLSGTMTIDGVALVVGDRVLVKNQSTPGQNGIYVVASGAWTRSTDADTWADMLGAHAWVLEGTTNADTAWVSTANAGGTIGTTDPVFVQYSGLGQITAGNGLTKTGNTIDLVTSGAGLTLAADSLSLTTLLQNFAGLTIAADTLVYGNGAGTFATTTFTAFGRSLVAAVDAPTARTTLGLGTMATQSAGAVAITGGTIDGVTIDGGTF